VGKVKDYRDGLKDWLNQPKPAEKRTMDERRKEIISMAREICLHRGENPDSVDRGGNEGWEKYEPLAGACIREAERLFALRKPVHNLPP
jgi:hypothetical protein